MHNPNVVPRLLAKHSSSLSLALLGLVAMHGCGDPLDSSEPVETPATGTGGSEASSTTSSTTGTAGGGGSDAPGGGGGGIGGELPTFPTGSPCEVDEQCNGGICFSEKLFGWAGGFCTEECVGITVCDVGAMCFTYELIVELQTPHCLTTCSETQPCRDGYACDNVADQDFGACRPWCTSDAQCAVTGQCGWGGTCVEAEDCTDGLDQTDDDPSVDCEDPECTATCTGQLTNACADATPLVDSPVSGDTMTGTQLFHGGCTGWGGASEVVFKYTAPAAGQVTFSIDTEAELGIYIRATCDDPWTELECFSPTWDGDPTVTAYEVQQDQDIFVFVDGDTSPGGSGPFTLTPLFVELVCGDGSLVWPEECDDGNTQDGDACSAACTVDVQLDLEPNDAVVEAQPVFLGTVDGAIYSGDADWFALEVSASIPLLTVLVAAGGCATSVFEDPMIEMFGADGVTSLALSDDITDTDYCSRVSAADVAPGTYFFRVASSEKCPGCDFYYSLYLWLE